MDFAERTFALDRAEHRAAGDPPRPACPKPLAYLWRVFLRLRRRKSFSDAGAPRPIEWRDFAAFDRCSGIHLAPWEIEILERIDDLFVYREDSAAAPSAARPMTEQLFDAIFA